MQSIVRAFQLLAIVTGYISGPIFLFVPLGWYIYGQTQEHNWLYGSVGIAFACSIAGTLWLLPKRLNSFYKITPPNNSNGTRN